MRISPQSRAALSALFIDARRRAKNGDGKPKSRVQIARKAKRLLREQADREDATPEERELWANAPVNHRQLVRLEHCPADPLGKPGRRAYLLAFALALGVDQAQINRFAGGI